MKIVTCGLMAVLVAVTAHADITSGSADRLAKAAEVVRESQSSIPTDLWDKARCVAVIPDLKKAAFIFGGEYGKGVVSCRAGESWSAPVFLQLAKGSWGFQAGAEDVDLILLVMNESGVQKLMKNKVSLGADASVAAGPVGRQGQVATDASLSAEILSYSRAKGLFAGINVSGGVLRPDQDDNEAAYGRGATPSSILAKRSLSAPTQATPFIQALGHSAQARAAEPTPVRVAARTQSPASSATGVATTDSDVKTQLVAMQQTVERLLSDQAAPVGTSGQTEAKDRESIVVSRAQLERLRNQIEALLASLNARGQ